LLWTPGGDNRLLAASLIALLAASMLGLRLYQLQVQQGGAMAALAWSNSTTRIVLEPDRGVIYDRHGTPLAVNQAAYALQAVPAQLSPQASSRALELRRLASLSGRSLAQLTQLLESPKNYLSRVNLATGLDPAQAQAVEELLPSLPGVYLPATPQRTYLEPEVFSHILGYTGSISPAQYQQLRPSGYAPTDSIGQQGLEAGLESELRGQSGWQEVQYDAAGNPVRTLASSPAVAGDSVYLSIDAGFQAATDGYLRQELARAHKVAGAAVVVDTRTGQVLAMASEPTFNPNLFSAGISSSAYQQLLADPGRPLYDRALDGLYAPGSTFKMITAAAALQQGTISPSTTMDCPSQITYDGWTYRNWAGYDMGTMNVEKAIAVSCDTFFYRTAQQLGDQQLSAYARDFGYGVAPQIEIPGAAAGVDPNAAWLAQNCPAGTPACVWDPGQTLIMGIGQSYLLTTPLIQAMYISAVANGGTLWRPSVVSRTTTASGAAISTTLPQVVDQVPVSPQAMDVVRAGMHDCLVAPYGTGYVLRQMHFSWDGGCKTGTAQYGGSGTNLPTHAWFALFSPYQNPEIAVVVLIENGGEGSDVAAPVAGEIANYYFAHRAQILAPSGI